MPYAESIIGQMAFYIKLMHGNGDFALQEVEAEGLAKALAGVLKYHIHLTGGGGRAMAYLTLLGCCAMVYTPKLIARSARAKAMKEKREEPLAPESMVNM